MAGRLDDDSILAHPSVRFYFARLLERFAGELQDTQSNLLKFLKKTRDETRVLDDDVLDGPRRIFDRVDSELELVIDSLKDVPLQATIHEQAILLLERDQESIQRAAECLSLRRHEPAEAKLEAAIAAVSALEVAKELKEAAYADRMNARIECEQAASKTPGEHGPSPAQAVEPGVRKQFYYGPGDQLEILFAAGLLARPSPGGASKIYDPLQAWQQAAARQRLERQLLWWVMGVNHGRGSATWVSKQHFHHQVLSEIVEKGLRKTRRVYACKECCFVVRRPTGKRPLKRCPACTRRSGWEPVPETVAIKGCRSCGWSWTKTRMEYCSNPTHSGRPSPLEMVTE